MDQFKGEYAIMKITKFVLPLVNRSLKICYKNSRFLKQASKKPDFCKFQVKLFHFFINKLIFNSISFLSNVEYFL